MEELHNFYLTFWRYFEIFRWATPIGLSVALFLKIPNSATRVRSVASVYAIYAVAAICLLLMQIFLLNGPMYYVSLCSVILWFAILLFCVLLWRRPNAQLLGAVALLVLADILVFGPVSHVIAVRGISIAQGLGAEQISIAQAVLMYWFPFPFVDGEVVRLGGYAVPRNRFLTWVAFRIFLMAATVLAYIVLSGALRRSCHKCFSVTTGTARFCRYCGTAIRRAGDLSDAGEAAQAK